MICVSPRLSRVFSASAFVSGLAVAISAAAPPTAAQASLSDYYLKIDGIEGEYLEIELRPVMVTSYQVGPSVDAPDPRPGSFAASPRQSSGGRASSDVTMKGSKINQNSPTSPEGRADIIVDAGPGTPSSGPGQVKVKLPWPACRAGARFPGAELRRPEGRYRLTGLAVAACEPESVTFTYQSLSRL